MWYEIRTGSVECVDEVSERSTSTTSVSKAGPGSKTKTKTKTRATSNIKPALKASSEAGVDQSLVIAESTGDPAIGHGGNEDMSRREETETMEVDNLHAESEEDVEEAELLQTLVGLGSMEATETTLVKRIKVSPCCQLVSCLIATGSIN